MAKKQKQIARTLFKKSLKNNLVDPNKVSQILTRLAESKTLGLKSILLTYKRLIETAIGRQEVVIEAATKIRNTTAWEKQLIQKTGAKKVIYKINPNIVFGARVTHGDWVWDATLGAKLKQLTISENSEYSESRNVR